MKSLVYEKCPIWLQNILISLYGYKVKSERFGSVYRSYSNSINLDSGLVEKKSEIFDFLSHAVKNVPFYEGLDINLKSVDDVESAILRFPIIEKTFLKANSERFLSKVRISSTKVINTSGTTGTPLRVKVSTESLQRNYVFFHKFLAEAGVSEFSRSATFAGRVLVPNGQKRPPFWRVNRAMNTLLLSSYHISKETAEDYIDALSRFAPDFIDSYPSAIFELANLALNLNIKRNFSLKAIITSSETLSDFQRSVIERYFGCPVFDYYGSAEQSVLAFQVPGRSSYVVPAEYCLVEVLDSDDRPVDIGEKGRIICTGFINKNMPLIRYDIGDEAVVSEFHENSRFVKAFRSIVGRTDDVIHTVDGYRIGRLDPVFKGIEGVSECQIIQHSISRIEVKVVESSSGQLDELKLKAALASRLGESIAVEVNRVDRIPRDSAGKFRSVISNIK